MAKLFVITGPSGVGKGTLIKEILSSLEDIVYSVSSTTRNPRLGEKDGVDYFFVSKEEFEKSVKNDEFLEYAEYSGNFYGTKKQFVENKIRENKSVILEIETVGAEQIMEKCPKCVSIFIMPPHLEELEKRLRGRKTESEENIQRRLKITREEILKTDKFKYCVVNDNFEEAFEKLKKIIEEEKC